MDRSGPVLEPLHLAAKRQASWMRCIARPGIRGLKTTYYLRSRSATHVEKSTVKRTDGKLNAVSPSAVSTAKQCAIDDPTCEACQ